MYWSIISAHQHVVLDPSFLGQIPSMIDKQQKKKIIMLRFLIYNMVLLSVMMVVSGEAKTMANTASLIFMSGNSQELGELLAW